MKPAEAGRIDGTIATDDQQIYPRVIQPSLLKALKSVFSQYELVTIATEWNSISEFVQEKVAEELRKFDYVTVQGLDLTGLQIAEEYRAAIEQKQIAEQEARRYETLHTNLDGQTAVVPALPGSAGGSGNPVIVNGRR